MLITVVTISLIINYSTNGINTILYPGISRDKIMADLLIYIPNDDSQNYPFFSLQLVVETFGHLTKRTDQSKSNKIPQSY